MATALSTRETDYQLAFYGKFVAGWDDVMEGSRARNKKRGRIEEGETSGVLKVEGEAAIIYPN